MTFQRNIGTRSRPRTQLKVPLQRRSSNQTLEKLPAYEKQGAKGFQGAEENMGAITRKNPIAKTHRRRQIR